MQFLKHILIILTLYIIHYNRIHLNVTFNECEIIINYIQHSQCNSVYFVEIEFNCIRTFVILLEHDTPMYLTIKLKCYHLAHAK